MTFPWWSLLPFVAMLACIALLPIIPATSHWWEKRSSQLIIALALGIPTLVYMRIMAGTGALIETGVEYVQFIALLLALFVISGGIHLEGDIEATPRNNTAFLAVGGVLASLVGTTGAAMLLIRPILATNKERVNRVHTVLFTIFVVANCGGLLTPSATRRSSSASSRECPSHGPSDCGRNGSSSSSCCSSPTTPSIPSPTPQNP